MKNGRMDKRVIKYMLLAAALVLVVVYFSRIMDIAHLAMDIVAPLAAGLIMAYVLNLLTCRIEKLYFPRSGKKIVSATRRPLSILLSFIIVIAVLFLLLNIVLPQVIKAITTLMSSLPRAIDNLEAWFARNEEDLPQIVQRILDLNIDLDALVGKLNEFLQTTVRGFLSSTLGFVTALPTRLFNLVMSVAFSIYLLAGKERILGQLRRVQRAFIRDSAAVKINRVLTVANQSFSGYIAGQFIEAVVLGTLCTVGMWIFRFPYATTIGVFVGATALIPIVGAYLGAVVGGFLILMVDPLKALLFIIYIIVLQQLETNLIYPRVVGNSIGLPGVWVLAAVVIGGGLFGVPGMLLGSPFAATVYKLLQTATRERLKKQGASPAPQNAPGDREADE